jgi:hypothetical protein
LPKATRRIPPPPPDSQGRFQPEASFFVRGHVLTHRTRFVFTTQR